jgi:hypothetical protein
MGGRNRFIAPSAPPRGAIHGTAERRDKAIAPYELRDRARS